MTTPPSPPPPPRSSSSGWPVPQSPPLEAPPPPVTPAAPPGGQWRPTHQHLRPQGPTNGLAIASMVLGALWLWSLGSVLALVLGYVAKRQIDQRGESGRGLALAGIILGWIGIGVLVLVAFVAWIVTNPEMSFE